MVFITTALPSQELFETFFKTFSTQNPFEFSVEAEESFKKSCPQGQELFQTFSKTFPAQFLAELFAEAEELSKLFPPARSSSFFRFFESCLPLSRQPQLSLKPELVSRNISASCPGSPISFPNHSGIVSDQLCASAFSEERFYLNRQLPSSSFFIFFSMICRSYNQLTAPSEPSPTGEETSMSSPHRSQVLFLSFFNEALFFPFRKSSIISKKKRRGCFRPRRAKKFLGKTGARVKRKFQFYGKNVSVLKNKLFYRLVVHGYISYE